MSYAINREEKLFERGKCPGICSCRERSVSDLTPLIGDGVSVRRDVVRATPNVRLQTFG